MRGRRRKKKTCLLCVAIANGEHPNGRRNEMKTKWIDGIYERTSERSRLRDIFSSIKWVSVCVSAEWRMNERKAQINCTYIYYVPIYAYIHTLLSKEDGIQPVYFAGILFCSHSHSHTFAQTLHTDIFISGGCSNLEKITTTEWERKSFYFVRVLCVFCSMHKSTVI